MLIGDKMLFTVVIPVYEAEKYICRAMDSVYRQTFKDYELIVVDNGATDNSYNIVKEFIDNHKDADIKCIRLEKNKGISGGRNAGINAAQGKFIALLDADDYWEKNKLEEVAKAIEKNSDKDVFWHWENQVGEKEKRVARFRKVDNSTPYMDLLLNGNCLSPTTVCVKTNALRKINGFDMKLDQGQEDYDCWLRIARNGSKFHLIEKPLSNWIIREDSLSAKHEQHFLAVIAMLKTHFKYLIHNGEDKKKITKLWKNTKSKQYCYLGRSLSLSGDVKRAIHYYIESIKCNPFFYKPYGGIVMALIHI